MNGYIEEASQLLNQIWNDQDVRVVEKLYSFGKDKFCLIDISLNLHGQDEDRKYVQSSFYRENIRRGNTLIQDTNLKKIYWGRKGTPKILDIRLEHLHYFMKGTHLNKEDGKVADIIFNGVNMALKNNKRIELVKTEKINGENAQVSYFRPLDSWVICSKNVSVVASTLQDLNMYKENRYKFAILIAEQWFSQIKNLTIQKIGQLKELLDGQTIIGEYCGNPLFQHLVRYESVCIKWFAMVNNQTNQYCFDPFKTKSKLSKFGFSIAKMKRISSTLKISQFYESLEQLYRKTAQAGLEDEEYGMQGSIVYFVVQEMKDGHSCARSIGAGKLKTLQYRFFRKIRQKMSRCLSKNEKKKDLIKKYTTEINQLQKSNSSRAPFPQEYYIRVMEAGLELVQHVNIDDDFIRGKFISILKVLFYALYKRISIEKFGAFMIYDENFMEKVTEIPFLRYNGLGCQSKIIYVVLGLPGMFKTYLGKKMQSHFRKLEQPFEILPYETEEEKNQGIKILQQQNKEENIYEHYYLDGSIQADSLTDLNRSLKKFRENGIYYKVILIKDEVETAFEDDNKNQYPYRLQTIIMCYMGQHEYCKAALTVQQKIDNLTKVTEIIKKNANFNQIMTKEDLQSYTYPFSKKTKIPNIHEFANFIRGILKAEDERMAKNNYCLLILRIEKIEGVEFLEGEEIDMEVEHLIKSSYPTIPTINFKNNK